MKNPIDPKQLVPAAQTAGANELSQEFWREFYEREQLRQQHKTSLVKPKLTVPPQPRTI